MSATPRRPPQCLRGTNHVIVARGVQARPEISPDPLPDKPAFGKPLGHQRTPITWNPFADFGYSDRETSLKHSEESQISCIFEDDGRRDMRDVIVGADFVTLDRGTEPLGVGEGTEHRLSGRYVLLA